MPKTMEEKQSSATILNWKESFIDTWEKEAQKTVKLLKAFPEHKSDIRPHEKLRSARELASGFLMGESVFVDACIAGQFGMGDPEKSGEPPATIKEIIDIYEKQHKESVAKVRRMSDDDFNKTLKFFVAPRQLGDWKCTELLAIMVLDHVHHRGQLSIYLRMAGGIVPSIYGPTFEESWM